MNRVFCSRERAENSARAIRWRIYERSRSFGIRPNQVCSRRQPQCANAEHRALEAIFLGDGCHCTKAGSRLREDRGCLCGLEGQVGILHSLLLDLGDPFCQRVKNLLGVDCLGPQWRGKRVMKRDGVSCQLNVEVDPVVTMNIERDVRYSDLERAIEESHARRVFCVP